MSAAGAGTSAWTAGRALVCGWKELKKSEGSTVGVTSLFTTFDTSG